MRRAPFVVGFFLLLLCSGWFFFRAETWKNYPSQGSGIVAFGDSLIEGIGASQGRDLVSLLSSATGLRIRNFGKGGDTTEDALLRLPQVFAAVPDPQVAIILLGGNDYLRKIPKAVTFRNLETIVRAFQERGAVVVLLGVRGGVLSDGFEDDFEDLAERLETAYVSDILEGLFGTNEYMSDAVHPNDRGYARIAERVAPVLRRAAERP